MERTRQNIQIGMATVVTAILLTTPAALSAENAERLTSTTKGMYGYEAVALVVLILGLLGLLFWLLLSWSHRLDQASYLGSVYRESVEDFEYKRLAATPRSCRTKDITEKSLRMPNGFSRTSSLSSPRDCRTSQVCRDMCPQYIDSVP